MRIVRQMQEERRRPKLDEVRRQLRKRSLVIRQMTAGERTKVGTPRRRTT
jgi:hypothetical protein